MKYTGTKTCSKLFSQNQLTIFAISKFSELNLRGKKQQQNIDRELSSMYFFAASSEFCRVLVIEKRDGKSRGKLFINRGEECLIVVLIQVTQ